MSQSAPLFLGFDLSTQQLKAIIITSSTAIVHESAVHFDNDLPQYKTSNGAIYNDTDERAGEVTAPVAMWLDAIDLLFAKMKASGVEFESIKAIGGSSQQHGSVYWSSAAPDALRNLDPTQPLRPQLAPIAFSLPNSPIWQDSSTTPECASLQEAVGGAQELADLTGSRAYERFTGPQIMKVYKTNPEAFHKTAYISLISSFLSTLFLQPPVTSMQSGFPAAVESSDASGMNLMDVLSHRWEDRLLAACGGDAHTMRTKLGGAEPAEGGTALGTVGPWWKQRWGFSADCLVSPFTGDNPATVASLIATPGSALLSLGTSTTFLLSLPPSSLPPKRSTMSHLLAHPTSKQASIIMLCYKNGALAREEVRDACAQKSWDTYNELVQASPAGNNGNMGLYFPLKEIIPPNVQGNYFFAVKQDDESSESFKPIESIPQSLEPRAILESQLLSIKSRILAIMPPNSPHLTKILITGGSARNPIIQQVVANVFDMDVYVASEEGSKEAAALGGALLAKWAYWRTVHESDSVSMESDLSYEVMRKEDASGATRQVQVASPHGEEAKIYEGLVESYRKCEQWVVQNHERNAIQARDA